MVSHGRVEFDSDGGCKACCRLPLLLVLLLPFEYKHECSTFSGDQPAYFQQALQTSPVAFTFNKRGLQQKNQASVTLMLKNPWAPTTPGVEDTM